MGYSKDIIIDTGYNKEDNENENLKWTSRFGFKNLWRNHKIILSVLGICIAMIIFDIALIYSFAELIQSVEVIF